jgi:replication factor C subunit 2/4
MEIDTPLGASILPPPAPSTKKASSLDTPWVEKYRPRLLTEVVGNEETTSRLAAIASDGNLPNLIISGPPGTGKTTSVLALARQLLGAECYKAGVLELNASDSRGIDVVRSKIKMFAQAKVTLPPNRHKIVILDEADAMTTAAQQALRRTMEIYSSTTRFALACNVSSKIIEPIQSRAAILRFSRLSDEMVLTRLKQVCTFESVSYTQDGLAALIFTAEGDMRNALNNLQATVSGFGHVNEINVFKVCDQPHPTVVKQIVTCCLEGKTKEGMTFLQALWGSGYSTSDIIGTLFKVVKNSGIEEGTKLAFLREVGFTHVRIAEGTQSRLQLLGLVGRLARIGGDASGGGAAEDGMDVV